MDQTLTKYTIALSKNTVFENVSGIFLPRKHDIYEKGIFQDDDMLPSSLFYQVDFDTPGSAVNRKAQIMGSYNIPERQMSMIIQKGEEVSRLQGMILFKAARKLLINRYFTFQASLPQMKIPKSWNSQLISMDNHIPSGYRETSFFNKDIL